MGRSISDIIDSITLSDMIGVFIGMLVLLALIYGILFYMKGKEEQHNASCTMRRENAVVIEKYPASGIAAGISEMPVLFELSNGDRVRLICKNGGEMVVGDKGCLKWQGNRYISFERDVDANTSVASTASYDQKKIPAWMQVEMEKNNQN